MRRGPLHRWAAIVVSPGGPATTAIQVLRLERHAAGNRLGPAPAVAVLVAANGPGIEADRLHDRLAAMDAAVAEEFAAARPGGEGRVAVFARLLVAILHCGRDLAAAVVPADDGAQWVLVELATDVDPKAAVGLARDLIGLDAGTPDAAVRLAAVRARAGDRMAGLDRLWAGIAVARSGHRDRPGAARIGRRVGEGASARRYDAAITGATARPAAVMAERKDATTALLARAGLPVPRQIVVADEAGAAFAAAAIGYPVVVKPNGASSGHGVAVGLADPAAVRAAAVAALRFGRRVIVEAMLAGQDHRLLVVAGRMVAATLRRLPTVVGDGRHDIRALVAAANRDPRRGGARAGLLPIVLDAAAVQTLADEGLAPGDVPAPGAVVRVCATGNHASGSDPVDVTARVHPDNAAAACQAARLLGLDVAGIDFISPDVGRSWRDAGGGICEVNRQPGLVPHMVAEGRTVDAGRPFVRHLLPGPTRVPIVAILAGRAGDAVATAVGQAFADLGVATGMATGPGLVAAGLPLADPGVGDPRRVIRLVDDPLVRAIVAVVPPGDVVTRGFGHGRADVAVIVGDEDIGAAAGVLRGIGARVERWPATGDATVTARRIAAAALTWAAAGR